MVTIATIERRTTDVDFGIHVASWDEFNALRARLLEAGYKPDAHKIHRLSRKDKEELRWEIDIVPFGKIAGSRSRHQLAAGAGRCDECPRFFRSL